MPGTTCFWRRTPGWCQPKATGRYCSTSGKSHFLCLSGSAIQWSRFCNGNLCPFQQCHCTQRICKVKNAESPELQKSCRKSWVNTFCSHGVTHSARGTVSGCRVFSLPPSELLGSRSNVGPLRIEGTLSSLSFQDLGVPATVTPVSCQKKSRWFQLPLHPICTPSLRWHGHTSVTTVNSKPWVHLPFTHWQLLPYNIAQMWNLTEVICLFVLFQAKVSLIGFYFPIEMVPLLVCPWLFTEEAVLIAWENGVELPTDELFAGLPAASFPILGKVLLSGATLQDAPKEERRCLRCKGDMHRKKHAHHSRKSIGIPVCLFLCWKQMRQSLNSV